MFLRSPNKENVVPCDMQTKTPLHLKQYHQQSPTKSPQLFPKDFIQGQDQLISNDNHNTLKFVEEQLNRVRQAYQSQRNQKWGISQEKTKLEGQVKILQIQRDSQYTQNQRIRIQLRELLNKLNEVQDKYNGQVQESFVLKNQNTSLKFQISQFVERETKLQQDLQRVLIIKDTIQIQNKEQVQEISKLLTETKLKDADIITLTQNLRLIENQNKRLIIQFENRPSISQKEFEKVCGELQNWKTAFEKKQQQFLTKATVLHQENTSLKRTLSQLDTISQAPQTPRPVFGLNRSCSLPTGYDTQEKSNEYHVRLFVKENQIQQLTKKIKNLSEEVESLKLENALLSKKLSEGSVFRPSEYHKYTQVQNAILRNSELKKQTTNLATQLQSKQKQVEKLSETISSMTQQLQSVHIQYRKLQAQVQADSITHQNTLNELNSQKVKLERDLQYSKTKVNTLQKQCEEKDKIIINYVNSQRK